MPTTPAKPVSVTRHKLTTPTEPQLVQLPVSLLRTAPWNYKPPGSDEEIAKLAESIRADRSAGVLAVREIKTPKGIRYEVFDGNHRLPALKLLGRTEAWCENFGPISKARAVLISYRRNTQWFATDEDKLNTLLRADVAPAFGPESMAKVMVESLPEIESMIRLPDPTPPPSSDPNTPPGEQFGQRLSVPITKTTWKQWEEIMAVGRARNMPRASDVLAYVVKLAHKNMVRKNRK